MQWPPMHFNLDALCHLLALPSNPGELESEFCKSAVFMATVTAFAVIARLRISSDDRTCQCVGRYP